jgi:C-terminal processing protease CtpA/Prc
MYGRGNMVWGGKMVWGGVLLVVAWHWPGFRVESAARSGVTARQVVQRTGPVDGGWGYLGVYLGDLTADQVRILGLPDPRGVIVGMVENGSPAANAGIRPNDCLLAVDGRPIVNRLQFFQMLMVARPGTKIRLSLLRDGSQRELEVEVGRRLSQAMVQRQRLFDEAEALLRSADENRRMAEEALAKGDEKAAARFREIESTLRQMSDDNRAWVEKELREGRISEPIAVQSFNLNMTLSAKRYQLGLTVVELSPQLAGHFKAGSGGLLLSEVRPGGAAEQAGIKAGDCLVQVDGRPIATPADLNRAIDQAVVNSGPGGLVELTLGIVREQAPLTLVVRL